MHDNKYICPRCGAFGMLVPDSEPIILSNLEIKAHEFNEHAEKLAEALRALRKSIRHAHYCKSPQAFPCSCDADKLWEESAETLAAYEEARK